MFCLPWLTFQPLNFTTYKHTKMSKEVKILIVEDDENLRFLVAHRLKTEGYNVLEANDGESGERMIIADQPDIVLLDWMMP